MSLARFQIVMNFEEPDYLYFDSGIVWSGDPLNGTRVIYSRSGWCKEIVSYANGKREGFRGLYLPSGHPKALLHYRRGELFGECQLFDQSGNSIEHVIYTGKEYKYVDFSSEILKDYPRHQLCKEDWDSAFHYQSKGPRGWTE